MYSIPFVIAKVAPVLEKMHKHPHTLKEITRELLSLNESARTILEVNAISVHVLDFQHEVSNASTPTPVLNDIHLLWFQTLFR